MAEKKQISSAAMRCVGCGGLRAIGVVCKVGDDDRTDKDLAEANSYGNRSGKWKMKKKQMLFAFAGLYHQRMDKITPPPRFNRPETGGTPRPRQAGMTGLPVQHLAQEPGGRATTFL